MVSNLKHIIDLETHLGYALSKIDFSDIASDVNYSFGDYSELISWIENKDSINKNSVIFYSTATGQRVESSKGVKYPLIWLETPIRGVKRGSLTLFEGAKIIISCETKPEWLNSTRWKNTIPLLTCIADRIVDQLRGVVSFQYRDNKKYFEYEIRSRYSTGGIRSRYSTGGDPEDKSKSQDWWDAIILIADLSVSRPCKEIDYINNYCNH